MAAVLTSRVCARTASRNGGHLAGFTRRVRLFLDLWSERRTLDKLDERMLADIGVERWQAEREARRNAWDVPDGRRASVDRYRLWQGF